MSPYPMRHFFYNNSLLFTLILVVGCSSIRPKHITRVEAITISDSLPSPLFAEGFEKVLYKATMDIRSHHLTGILFIKRFVDTLTERPIYRLLFSNEFGMTYFDLEFTAEQMKIHYCFEPMNKKALLSVLETNFHLLVYGIPNAKREKWFIQQPTRRLILKHIEYQYTIWSIYSADADTLLGKNGKSNLFDKVRIRFSGSQHGIPVTIMLENPIIGLFLSLQRLN